MARAALVLLVLASAASASSPLAPWEVTMALSDAPAVARDVTLSVRIDSRMEMDLRDLTLDVPAWVEPTAVGEWPEKLGPGESATRDWQLRANREGFWSAGLTMQDGSMGWCCLFARSDGDGGASALDEGSRVIPEPRVDSDFQAVAENGSHARLTLEVVPRAPWMRHARIAASLDDPNVPGAPPGETARAERVVELPPGASTVVTRWVGVRVEFESSIQKPQTWGRSVECLNMEIAREGDVVRIDRSWSCEAVEARPIPGAGALLVALAAAGALFMRRRLP